MKTVNHESYVSLEVAKLLKEAGFDWECRRVYCNWGSFVNDGCIEDNEVGPCNWNGCGIAEQYSAPTLDIAQRWLRDVKNISADISSNCYSEWGYIIRKINQLNYKDNTIFALTACRFYTYEEAMESGIIKSLEIILEKSE